MSRALQRLKKGREKKAEKENNENNNNFNDIKFKSARIKNMAELLESHMHKQDNKDEENKRELKRMTDEIVNEEKKKIDQKNFRAYNDEYDRKKIEISTFKNKTNLNKMKVKHELLTEMIDKAFEKIKDFAKSDNQEYKSLLKELIVECMTKLLEPECIIRVRKSDENYIRSILNECQREYESFMKKETSKDYRCKLSIDDDYLEEEECGGVVFFDLTRKIILKNTLRERLNLTKEAKLPEIKKILFPS